jgi:hypothetical protein
LALSIARTAKAAQSSSEEKEIAMAAPEIIDETGNAGESAAKASGRQRTRKSYGI